MINVSSALKGQEIISLLDDKSFDGIHFKFVKKEGINLFFDVDTEDLEKAVSVAKGTIKATDFGAGLFFRIAYEGRRF